MKPYHFIIPKGFSLYKNSSIIYQTHVLTRFPLAIGIQPVSEGWIGLDTWARRADTPIRQVLKSVSQRRNNYKFSSLSFHFVNQIIEYLDNPVYQSELGQQGQLQSITICK